MTSRSGLPFNSWISSPGLSPILSATEPFSTANTRSFCVESLRCAGASRYSCTALRTYADAENCFLVLLIPLPLAQSTSEVMQTGKCRHQAGHIENDVQFRNGHVLPIGVEHGQNGEHLHHSAGLS